MNELWSKTFLLFAFGAVFSTTTNLLMVYVVYAKTVVLFAVLRDGFVKILI